MIKILTLTFIIIGWGSFVSVQAQRNAGAAGGGSNGKNANVERNDLYPISDLIKYRVAIRNLNFNEDVLTGQLNDLLDKKAKIKLKDLILAYLIIERNPAERVAVMDEFILSYPPKNDFYQTIRTHFNLDKAVFQNRKDTAEQTLKNALKVKVSFENMR